MHALELSVETRTSYVYKQALPKGVIDGDDENSLIQFK